MIGLGVLLKGLERVRGAAERICHAGPRKIPRLYGAGDMRDRYFSTIRKIIRQAIVMQMVNPECTEARSRNCRGRI
jgi:hypothetical protein